MNELLDEIRMMRNNGQAYMQREPLSPTLLDEFRDLAVAELSAAMAQVLELTTKELLDMAGRNPSHAMYCLYMDTWEQVSAHQQAIAGLFGRQLFQRFGEARRRTPRLPPEPTPGISELNLVEPEELELTLASNTISHALSLACGEELPALDQGVGLLLEDPDMRLGPNPVGPDALGEVLMEAIRTLQAGNKHKLLLVTRVNAHLPGQVKQVYQRLHRFLLDHGIALGRRPTVRHAVAGESGEVPKGTAAEASGPVDIAGKPQPDLFSMLQQLMAMGRIGEGGGMASPHGVPSAILGEAANEGEVDTSQVMHHLTQIQHGEMDDLPGGPLDPRVVNSGTVNVLRVIKHAGAAGSMTPMDSMTLDIVALIFDYILDDRRLPDAMKALIGRLQIPVLKVAMLDKNFFSQKSHPARRFLDALADAALGWNPREGHDSLFYQTVDTLVQQVLNEFEDRVDVFVQALESLQSFMTLEKRQADERACHLAQVVQHTEQVALAHTVAVETIQAHCLNQSVPAAILGFLHGTWANHLANQYLRDGANGQTWLQGLDTVDELLWSLTPKTSKEDRQKLVSLLPRLLKQLDDGIKDIQLPQAERDRFFTDLVKLHAESVRAGLHGGKVQDVVPPPTQTTPPPRPAYIFDTPELRDIVPPESPMDTDPRILREISAMPPAEDAASPPAPNPLEDGDIRHYEALVQNLKRGTWLEFTLEDDSQLRAKLAWVSPLRGTYLFTNRLGERAVSINAAGLARKMREGMARVVDNAALIDRAVGSLFDRLKKS